MVINLYLDSPTQIERRVIDGFLKNIVSSCLALENRQEDTQLLNLETFPTEEQGTRLIKLIRDAFKSFLQTQLHNVTGLTLEKEDEEKLAKKLGVHILYNVKDTEESGNSWYWFAHSGQFINQ